jgi:hypothetical protein
MASDRLDTEVAIQRHQPPEWALMHEFIVNFTEQGLPLLM